MRPILFEWRGVRIWSYPAMLYVGLCAGVVAGNYAANVDGLASRRVLIATLILIVPALVGARLLFVATHWELFRRDRARVLRHREGGAAMLGGLILAVLVSIPLLALMDLPPGAFWDVAMITILVGMIPTRVGCLLNGCCGGRPTQGRLGLWLPDPRGVWTRRVPTQLLEGAVGAVLLAGAILVWAHRPFPGFVFLAAVAGYGAGRTLLEPARDAPDRVGAIRVHQALGAAMCLLGLAGLAAASLLGGPAR